MAETGKKWETYEEVAIYLLNQMANDFGLDKVEANQKIIGLRSGTEWNIEGKGIANGGEIFVIVECRRYTTSSLKQESIGGLAYRIIDTGASGGIIVTPIGLQEGAEKIAESENILIVIIDENSSSTDYVMKFLDQIKVGRSGELSFEGTLGIRLMRKDGTIEDLGTI